MLAQGDRLTIPAVGDDGDWIVKLPDSKYPEVPRNELAMMELAKASGIDVPEVRLVHRDQIAPLPDRAWPNNEDWAFAIQRFDRGPGRERIHIEDMAQVRGFYPDDKYSGSFETIGALAYRRRDISSLQEFARRVAFNVLIGNGDAHLKNWSLIYRDPGVPTLAPAYDLVATFVYRPEAEGPEDMALYFGRSKRFEDVKIATFCRLDEKLEARADLSDVVSTLINQVLTALPRAEESLNTKPEFSRIGSFVRARASQLKHL